jgi:hypothetical protein
LPKGRVPAVHDCFQEITLLYLVVLKEKDVGFGNACTNNNTTQYVIRCNLF